MSICDYICYVGSITYVMYVVYYELSEKTEKTEKQQKSQLCPVLALGKAGHCMAVVLSFAESQPPDTRQRNIQKNK